MKQEATKHLQEYIDRMQAKGIIPTMEDLNHKMGKIFRTQNNAPRAEFEGYSSLEMHKILHFAFDKDSQYGSIRLHHRSILKFRLCVR